MSSRRSRGKDDCRLYIGNLPPDVRERDIEDLFDRYGNITRVDLKNKRGAPFAFIEYEDYRWVGFFKLNIQTILF